MKKNILLLMLILVGITKTSSAQVEKFKFTWTFRFEIASYSQDCNSGFGLCFIPPQFNFRTVEAGITLEEQSIQIHINRNSLHENLERELLRLTQFPIAEGTVLPIEVSRKLGLRGEVILKSGYCPLIISDDFISIICLME
jgi:hypothetical protein